MEETGVEHQGSHFASLQTCLKLLKIQRVAAEHLLSGDVTDENKELVAGATSKLTNEIEAFLQAPNVLYPHVEALAKDAWLTLKFALELPHLDLAKLLDTRAVEHVCHYLYILAKVVGISKCLEAAPTGVCFFIPALDLLERIYTELNPADLYARGLENFWCVELILLAWQSLLVRVPFGFHLFLDDVDACSAGKLQVAQATRQVATRVICLANGYLDKATRARDMAAMLICHVLARPDVIACGLTREYILNITGSDATSIGMLHVLKQLAKRAPSTLEGDLCGIHLMLLQGEKYTSSCEKTLQASCLGYLGLIVLDYSSSSRDDVSLESSGALVGAAHCNTLKVALQQDPQIPLANGETQQPSTATTTTKNVNHTNTREIIEAILSKLLTLVLEPVNPIRWAACKSLGRLSAKLPPEWCLQILNHLAANVRLDNATECIMHGSCMAIAQIVQFGRMEASMYYRVVVDAVCLGLGFNLWRGNASAGASVRDACCYICWAVARSVANVNGGNDDILSLSRELVNVALFDSSINCRRAACAAIQEMVGRWGSVPYGLGLLKVLDYYSVGNFQRAFINLSAKVAALGHGWYTSSMLTFVYKHKLHHPNFNLRRMAAIAMAKLSPPATNIYLDLYVANATIGTPSVMHGSLLALTSTLSMYKNNAHLHKYMADVKRIPCTFEKRRLFRGKGGGMQREATCRLVGAIAMQRDTNIDAFMDVYTTILKDSLRNFTTSVQVAAADALGALVARVVDCCGGAGMTQGRVWVDTVREFLMRSVANVGDNVAARRGYALALAKFSSCPSLDVVDVDKGQGSARFLQDSGAAFPSLGETPDGVAGAGIDDMLQVLVKLVVDGAQNYKDSDANVRQYSLLSMAFVLEGIDGRIKQWHLEAASRAIEAGARDMECDARGDVGSWVRSVACEVGTLLLQRFVKATSDLLHLEWASRVLGSIAHVALDPLDNVRARAIYLLVMSLAPRHVNGFMSAQDIWQRILYGCHYKCKLEVGACKDGAVGQGKDAVLEEMALELYRRVKEENVGSNLREMKDGGGGERMSGGGEELGQVNSRGHLQELGDGERVSGDGVEQEDNGDDDNEENNDKCVLDHVIVDKASFPLPGWSILATSFPLLFYLLEIPKVSKLVASGLIRLLGSRHRQVDALLYKQLMQLDEAKRQYVAELLGKILKEQYKQALDANDHKACLVSIVAARSLVQLGLTQNVDATLDLALEQAVSCKNYAHVKALVKLVYEALEFRRDVLGVALAFLHHEYPTIRSHALECLELYLLSMHGRVEDVSAAADVDANGLGEAMQMIQAVKLDDLESVENFIQQVVKFVAK